MKVWFALLKKEYHLTKPFVWGGLILLLLTSLLEVYLAYNYNVGAVVLSVVAIIPHVFYLLVYMLISLSMELRHTGQLWLHLPQPGWMLLSSKFVSGLLAMLVSISIALGFGLWVGKIEYIKITPQLPTTIPIESIHWGAMAQLGAYVLLGLIFTAIYYGFWAMAIYVIMASLKKYIKRGRILVGLGVLFISSWIINTFQSSAIYNHVTHWGLVNLPVRNLVTPENSSPDWVHLTATPVYIGEFAFYLLIIALLFWLSSWLLDNKVEV